MTEQETFKPNPTQELLIKIIRSLRETDKLYERMGETRRGMAFDVDHPEKTRSRDMRGSTHAINTYLIARELTEKDVNEGLIDETEKARLRIAALIHDLGELGQGDVDYNKKTLAHTADEIKYFLEQAENFFPNLSAEEITALKQIYIDVAQNKDRSHKEANYFNEVEFMGYTTHMLEEFAEKRNNVDWKFFCDDYLHNIGQRVREIIQSHPAAKTYLSKSKKQLGELVDWVENQITNHPEEVRKLNQTDIQYWRDIQNLL